MVPPPSQPPDRPSLRRSAPRGERNGQPLALPPRISLVLGGGGLKGFAHIGALRAFEERNVHPSLVAGTSIGAMIAAAYVGGMPVAEMERRALALTKQDLFRIDHFSMVAKRMLSPALYLERPLKKLVDEIVPHGSFRGLQIPLLVNTTDLEDAAQVLWGLPGLQDVSVRDAVYASCALPGFFPPAVLGGRTCADGGVIDNVPVVPASFGMDAVIAIDVGSTNIARARRIREKGFAAIYMRAAQVMMKSLQHQQLAAWQGPPLLLVRPAVWNYNWFSFANVERMIELGYLAANDSLDRMGNALLSGGGVWPRRVVEVSVNRAKCIGCTLCTTLAPRTMAMDQDGKARVLASPVEWSRADGDFVHQCPTEAITVEALEPTGRRSTLELPVLED